MSSLIREPNAMPPVLVWFRDDLRLDDHPALSAAAADGAQIIPVFIFEDNDGQRPLGSASRWWLHHSLAAHAARLETCGAQLIIRRGKAREEIARLLTETGATTIHWNRRYRPQAVAIDTALKADLTAQGIKVVSHPGSVLKEPFTLLNGQGLPYKVFTPYWRALRATGPFAAPLSAPERLNGQNNIASLPLDALDLLPKSPNWAAPFSPLWQPGEQGAQRRLHDFLDDNLVHYADERDRPDRPATSRLSPFLRFGEISPNHIAAAVETHVDEHPSLTRAAEKFLSEIGWREFSAYLLWHFPKLPSENFSSRFDAFPWRNDERALRAWQRGATGIPIVDAGMRELWQTGTMHNRVRMLVASFLTKNLMIDWRHGEKWFFDTLLDADEANNAASWQWVAGSGADAAPYFRIFNPVTQGEKFDPDGLYVRRFVPELGALPSKHIHNPSAAPVALLAAFGIRLGETYPVPLTELAASRERALHAFKTLNAG
jgi:deoxyribodipyrimidine photo-lyase